MTLFYIPLESYAARYTLQWSAPVTGWLERNWVKAGIQYHRVDPGFTPREIKHGSVVDGVGRSLYCFDQIRMLLDLAEAGQITDNDVIYFDDFWTPGLEALPYAFHLMGIKPKMYAFLHAQSVDEFDFTHPMRGWMRHFEQGIAAALDGIFVCGPCLQDLVVFGGIAPREKVHVTGHPFNSEEVMERMPVDYAQFVKGVLLNEEPARENKVIFSSRWDSEKNPKFFLAVADRVLNEYPELDAKFVVCTSAAKLRSNDRMNVEALYNSMEAYPDNIILKQGLTKEQYYEELCTAKVQMNTADQDFVAITLLEASVAGTYPIYPYFRSFPETFDRQPGFMYTRLDEDEAAMMVGDVLSRDDLWTAPAIRSRQWLHTRFDTSWVRQLVIMGLLEGGPIIHSPYDIPGRPGYLCQ